MASLLGTLRVRLTAETEDFRRGLANARQSVGSLQKDLNKFRMNTMANVASVGALGMVLKSSIDVANRYDNAQRQLAATAKLTGVELGYLQSVSHKAQGQFKLSGISANAFTIELTKLAGKAGDVGKASAGLEALLDIGAARGLDANQTLKAVQQSILGIDEGTDKLFSKNPSVLYAEYAKEIGKSAAKLSDKEKAQALLNAAMKDGEKVRGEYQKWLQSSQGQQYLLTQSMEKTQEVLGKALQPALVAIIPLVAQMADWVQKAVQGWQMLGATATLVPALIKAGMAKLRGNSEEASQIWNSALDGWREMIAEIQNPVAIPAPFQLDVNGGTGNSATDDDRRPTGKKREKPSTDWVYDQMVARASLASEMEQTRTEGFTTYLQQLEQEERHALALLDIEERRERERAARGEIQDDELQNTLRRLDGERQLTRERRQQMSAATTHNARLRFQQETQQQTLNHSLEAHRILGELTLSRLEGEGKLEERYDAQKQLIRERFQLMANAIRADSSLEPQEQALRLGQLELDQKRELLALLAQQTMAEEQLAREREQSLKQMAISLATDVVGGLVSGQGISGQQIGAGIGAIAGSFIPGIGTAIGSTVGGIIGGLFGGKSKEAERPPVIRGLEAIERAQRETIQTIEAQTDALLNPESRLLALPSNFNIPGYKANAIGREGGGAPQVNYGDTHITLQITTTTTASPEEIKRMAYDGITEALRSERHNFSLAGAY